MIIRMEKLRVLGPRDRLEAVLDSVQALGLIHLTRPRPEGLLHPLSRADRHEREARWLDRALADHAWLLERLPAPPPSPGPPPEGTTSDFARWARSARRLRREVAALEERRGRMLEERTALSRYERYFEVFESLVPPGFRWDHGHIHYLILRPGAVDELDRLHDALSDLLEGEFELLTAPVEGGGLALVLLVPSERSAAVDRILGEVGVEELPLPAGYGGTPLGEAIPGMRERLAAIDRELAAIEARRRALGREHGVELSRARASIGDRRLELDALSQAMETERAFVLSGWVPADARRRVVDRLAADFGDEVVVEVVSAEEWAGREAPPVELSNPRLFRPFEAITRTLPLPRYGSIDPTPFVAVFFPMFFGVILGDVAYGLALAAIAGVLHWKSRPDTLLRSVAEIAGACAAFSIAFGALYGEALGDVGRRWLGLRPLFDREEALMPFLVFTLGLGVVHVMLGLVLGAIAAFHEHRRASLGRGISALMVALLVVAILAAAEVLPGSFFTPAVIALLVAFPVLVVAEGILAPVEFLSTVGNILSYARIMALGTASVVMAVVANRMVGALGGAVVGVLFGLIFHLVNFALGVFGPAIHAVRLHYVEFFGKFYSPGGEEYRPFGPWKADPGRPA